MLSKYFLRMITQPHSNTPITFIKQKSKLLTTITAELEVSCSLDFFITDLVVLLVGVVVVVDVVVVEVVNSTQELSLIIIA